MTVTKARSFAPGLQVVDAEPEADSEGLRRLALWAGRRHAPLVAPDPPDGIWLDVTGCAALFLTERALIKDLHRRTLAFGLSVQIGVADTAGCAHAVARHVPPDGRSRSSPARTARRSSCCRFPRCASRDRSSTACASSGSSGWSS